MDFTIAFNTGLTGGVKRYDLTFDGPNGERRTVWYVSNLAELTSRVAEWDNDPPIKDWFIKTIEQCELPKINPSVQAALERMGYIKKIGEPGQ